MVTVSRISPESGTPLSPAQEYYPFTEILTDENIILLQLDSENSRVGAKCAF
jgi:hypothetical protein